MAYCYPTRCLGKPAESMLRLVSSAFTSAPSKPPGGRIVNSTAGTRSCRFGPLLIDYDEQVLTPRTWTFQQSEWAAEVAADAAPGALLELCAGAGHIGLAAAILADRDLVQVEANHVAAGYARSNAARAGWAQRVEVRTARLEQAVRPEERFPVIIADPPYLRSADVSRWPQDPPMAIDGGADGLAVVTGCLQLAAGHLTEGGQLLLQIAGPAQGECITDLLTATPAWGLMPRAIRVLDRERAILLVAQSAR